MRVLAALGSEAAGEPVSPQEAAAGAVAAEKAGFGEAWCPHFSRGLDSLTLLAFAAAVTDRIKLGVGVVPTYPRHPAVLAQSAATLQQLSGGRLTLGVGVSHRPLIEGMYGLDYAGQLGHLREYLTVLVGLLTDGSCSFAGEHYRAEASIGVPGTSPVPVVVGALSPQMSRMGGELADGVTTWLAGPRSLERVVVPATTEGAAAAGRGAPRVVAGMPVALDADRERAREAAARLFARYGTLVNYQRLFAREEVDGPAELVVTGDEEQVRSGLRALFEAGATEVWAIPFDTGNGTSRTVNFLAELARG